MKKIKILAFILTFSLIATSNIFAEAKNLDQTKTKELKIKEENIVNNLTEKEKEKYYVEDYEIKQIIKKGILTIVHYEHKKSYAQFLVFFDNLKRLNINPQTSEYSKGKIYIKCDPGISFATLTAFRNFINESLQQRLKFDFSEQELVDLGFYSEEFFHIANQFNIGYGLYLDFNKYDKKLFKSITDILKRPAWLRFKKTLKLSLQQTKNNLEYEKNMYKKIHEVDLDSKMLDRFYFSKFTNYDGIEELDKLLKNEDFLWNTHDKIFNPSNFLIQINGNKNRNYKEIMKEISKNTYFEYRDEENTKKPDEKKLSNFTEKKQYREIKLNTKSTLPSSKKPKNYKYEAKLFWDISKIPEKERSVFLTKNEIYNDFLKEEIKKMGYNDVKALQYFKYPEIDYNSILFDGLYYINICGSDKKYFTKEKLEENGQKLIKMLYEKIKNISDEEILNSVYYDIDCVPEVEDYLNFYNSTMYDRMCFENLYLKSYYLTNNPFNKKYFNFKNNRKIEFKTKDLIETFRKYNKNFEKLFNSKPKYIDLFIANEESKKNKNEFINYLSPIYENFGYDKKKPLKDLMLASLNFETIYDKFYKPNLIDKNLIRKEHGGSRTYFSIKPENLAKVEDYIFNKFKKEIKEYVLTKDEINKIKAKEIKNLNLKIKNSNRIIEEYKDILNNNEKFKQYLKTREKEETDNHKRNVALVKNLKKLIKKLENEKTTTKKEKKENLDLIKSAKGEIQETKKFIKKFEEKVKNKNYFSNEVKKHIKDQIKWQKQTIKEDSEKLECIDKLTDKDFVNFYKNLNFSSSSHLKPEKTASS